MATQIYSQAIYLFRYISNSFSASFSWAEKRKEKKEKRKKRQGKKGTEEKALKYDGEKFKAALEETVITDIKVRLVVTRTMTMMTLITIISYRSIVCRFNGNRHGDQVLRYST